MNYDNDFWTDFFDQISNWLYPEKCIALRGFELGNVSSLFLETSFGSCQSVLEFL